MESTGQNLNDVRLINRAVVFRTIHEAGLVSRALLAKSTGLNPATVTHIIRELIQQGLIEEAGSSKSSGGRPGSMLRIRSQAGYIIAIQLDRLYIKGMLTNLNLEEKIHEQVISSVSYSPSEISIDILINMLHRLIERSKLERHQILGIGICAPGPLDAARGVFLAPPNFPGWKNTPVKDIIQKELGIPTFLEQDANACALAEKWFGNAREYENFVYLLGDGGLGGGLFLHGDIYRGDHNIAGEIGHTTIDLNGPPCSCGNLGCLELFASPKAVVQQMVYALNSGKSSLVLDMISGQLSKLTFQAIVHAAEQGDALSLEMISSMGKALAAGIINIINIFDPQAVVIGGQIVLVEDQISAILEERTNLQSLTGKSNPYPIHFSELHQDAPIIGAFSLVLRELFRDPFFRG